MALLTSAPKLSEKSVRFRKILLTVAVLSQPSKKAPYRIVRRVGGVFAFAGIWQAEKQTSSTEPRFAIITTRANDLMRPIHLRMPVILTPEQESIWLSGKTPVPELLALLEPAPSKDLRAFEVSLEVNRATIDTPAVMEPV
jgi:putative SOS response-associated peptidase YedK